MARWKKTETLTEHASYSELRVVERLRLVRLVTIVALNTESRVLSSEERRALEIGNSELSKPCSARNRETSLGMFHLGPIVGYTIIAVRAPSNTGKEVHSATIARAITLNASN
uniref:Uncharacterized protein n=1 Tax=Vespula pensylvanica TaxID=30213 RepID=A0A834JPW1_VESPE|nr:hypothetical protein H0235_017435 [Vespula pensylvanica]